MNASIDKLTGLYTQKAFEAILNTETHRAFRYKRPFCLIMAEVHFDYYVSDYNVRWALLYTVFKQLAPLVTEGLRKIDMAARYGGENIVVMLPETPAAGGLVVAERMRKRVDSQHFAGDTRQPTVKVALNVGMAVFPVHGKTPKEIVGTAQKAMLLARSQGGNQVVQFPDPLHADFPPPPAPVE